MDVRMFTVGPVAENCFLFRRDGSDRALIVDPGDEARADPRARSTSSASTVEAILLTHTPLRPHRRRRAGRARRPARRSSAPRSRRRCSPTSCLRPLARLRPVRELRGRPHASSGGEQLELAGLRDRRDLHARPQPRPRHLLDPRRGGDLLRRRPLPGLGRPHRPARRRLGRRCSSRSATLVDAHPPETDGLSRAHGDHDARAPSARPTRSSPSSRASRTPGKVAAPWPRSSRPRGAPSTCCPSSSRLAPPDRATAARGSLEARRLRPDRDARSSRTPSCSRAASASPPTSSRRRCSPSRTRAGARSPCGPRARRRSAAPTSSTACTSCRSR